jgi:hypothetical protein
MDWVSASVSAAIVAGIVSLLSGFITAAVTIRVARQRAGVDERLAELKGEIHRDVAQRRAVVDERLSEMRASFEKELAEQKERLDNRTLFAAEQVAHSLLMHPEWKSRTFRIIKARLGGFDDDAFRQILVRAGAIRLTGRDGTERWGLLDRNRDLLVGFETRTPAEEEEISGS